MFVKARSDEPIAVFRFKHRTGKQLQQLLSTAPPPVLLEPTPKAEIPSKPSPEEPKPIFPVKASDNIAADLPKARRMLKAVPFPGRLPLEPYDSASEYPSVPSFGSIDNIPPAVEQLRAHTDKEIQRQPFKSIQRSAFNPASTTRQIPAQTASDTQSQPSNAAPKAVGNTSPVVKRFSTPSESCKLGQPTEPVIHANLNLPTALKPSPEQADGSAYPPLVPLFESILNFPSGVEKFSAQIENNKAGKPLITLLRPIFSLHGNLSLSKSQLSRIGHRVSKART